MMMGTFQVSVRVFSLKDPERGRDLDLLVDTGAIQSTIPRAILEQLDVPVERRQSFRLANGEPLNRDVG